MSQDRTTAADALEGLRRRWALALLVGLPMFATVLGYAEGLADTFRSTAVVSLTPRPEVQVGGDVLRVVVPKYVAYLDSGPSLTAVSQETGIAPDVLGEGLDVSVAPETANVEISVELRSAADAALAAQVLADRAVALSATDRLLVAEVLVPPVVADEPAGPRRRLIEAGGLLLSLLAGVTVAVLADRSQPRVSSTDELARLTGLRTLAAVPRNRRLRVPTDEALDDPLVSAAVGTLLVQLESESRLQPIRLLAVTSPGPGDGKTTVACAVAAGMARLDNRVLLVDADLHRPRAAGQLGLEDGDVALADVLEGNKPFEEVVVRMPGSSLSVLPSLPHPEASTLLARRLKALLDDVGDRYDTVVLDCPPVLATDDALVVSVMCDATLLVVDRGSRTADLQAATSTLLGVKVRVVGAVLNRARPGAGGSQAYGSYARR